MIRKLAKIVVLAILVYAGCHAARSRGTQASSQVEAFASMIGTATIGYSSDLPEGSREEAAAAYYQAVREITDAFGPIPFPHEVDFLNDAEFDSTVRPWFPTQYDQVGGLSVFDGGSRVYIRARVPNLEETVSHELFHVLWCAAENCRQMPPWLVEGAAIAYSEGLDTTAPDTFPATPPAWWSLPGKGFHGPAHPGDPHTVGRLVMASLARTHGPEKVREFLALVLGGETGYRDAWLSTFGFPLRDVGEHL